MGAEASDPDVAAGERARKRPRALSPVANRPTADNPYPLEGRYVDAADRARIDALPELERERLLGERAERVQELRDRAQVKALVAAREAASDPPAGRLSGKAAQLAELRRRRQDGSSRRAAAGSGRRRTRRSGDASDVSEEDDGDEGAESDARSDASGSVYSSGSIHDAVFDKRRGHVDAEMLTPILITRRRAVDFAPASTVADWLKGALVRVSIGSRGRPPAPVYSIGRVKGVELHSGSFYEVDGTATRLRLTVALPQRDAESLTITLDRISNSAPADDEWRELLNSDGVVPSRSDARSLGNTLSALTEWRRDDTAMLSAFVARLRFRQQEALQSGSALPRLGAADRLRLDAAKSRAATQGDTHRVEEIDALLNDSRPDAGAAADSLAAVNARNRTANRAEIRAAEVRAVEQRRRAAQAPQNAAAAENDEPQLKFEDAVRAVNVELDF